MLMLNAISSTYTIYIKFICTTITCICIPKLNYAIEPNGLIEFILQFI